MAKGNLRVPACFKLLLKTTLLLGYNSRHGKEKKGAKLGKA
jgi:hypothetical protein